MKEPIKIKERKEKKYKRKVAREAEEMKIR